jgi:hypothetical protein
MATTQLADVIIPEVYSDYEAVNSPEKTAFFQSGVVTSNALLNQKANSGGDAVNIPFWKDLDATAAPNESTDDPTDIAAPGKLTAGKQVAYNAYLNNGWSASDLAGELAGSDPMARIKDRVEAYWARQWQRRIIGAVNGVIADNEDNHSSDMINDVSVEIVGSQTADTRFTRANFVDAAFTLGDSFANMGVIAMHSAVYKTLVNLEDITFIKDSIGNLTIPTYQGHRVVVDDGMPSRAGDTSGVVYTSVLFGAGAFGYGAGSPRVPVEVEREAAQGEGGGIETIWTRKTYLLHPFGYAQTAPAAVTHTPTELATAATWTRVVDRKNIPMAFLITN